MDKYSSKKYEIYRHQMCSFKFQMHQNPFSAGAPPPARSPGPCGGAYGAPPDSYSVGEGIPRAEIPILWVLQLSVSPPKEAEARQTCPGFFLKSLLESPGNLLEICLIKFVDTLLHFEVTSNKSSSILIISGTENRQLVF